MAHTRSLASAASLLAASLLAGCGANSTIGSSTIASSANAVPGTLSGKLFGGPNPVIGALVTLYSTGPAYGAGATPVTTASTDTDGFFSLSLPTTSAVCTAGQYLYVTSQGGNTGSNSANNNSLLMVPIGSCTANYTVASSTTGTVTTYTNTYTGSNLWINEITTAVSAYALSGFMSVTGNTVNIGAPAANTATYSSSINTPSAGGLAHAFANALSLVNISTGQPYATFGNHTGYGIVPDGELFLLGNILQACVNSSGTTGSNSGTANDGTACGKLFSLTTPPVTGSATPTNTLGAMLNLAHYPALQGTTWASGCTSSTGGTNTANACLFGLAAGTSNYAGALSSAPPDWALAVVWPTGYGANTTAAGCTTAGTCPGFTYPYYVATDSQDNVFVLNLASSANSGGFTNVIGVAPDGTPLFSSPKDTTNLSVKMIGTDTVGHVFGANNGSSPSNLLLWDTTSGTETVASSAGGSTPLAVAADPFNNIYAASTTANVNLRKYAYPGYAVTSFTTSAPTQPVLQIGFNSALDLFEFAGYSSTVPATAYLLFNKGTVAAPSYGTAAVTTTLTGQTANASGIAATSSNNLVTINGSGSTGPSNVTSIIRTPSGTTATLTVGTAVSVPGVYNGTAYNRYLLTDGDDKAISVDGANGSSVTGVSVVDTAHSLYLGTYKGCYVISGACGTSAGQVPMYSPRGQAIDSAGDIWVVSGASANMAELIGAAAPTWPGLSMAKSGRPQ